MNDRNTILSPWRAEVNRHRTDPKLDELLITETYEYVANEGSRSAERRVVSSFLGHDHTSPLFKVLERICQDHNALIYNRPLLAVGSTPEDAIRAWAYKAGYGEVREVQVDTKCLNPEKGFDWSAHLIVTTTGDTRRCAGRYVPGGVILTWWD
jgi:hypothetical protein